MFSGFFEKTWARIVFFEFLGSSVECSDTEICRVGVSRKLEISAQPQFGNHDLLKNQQKHPETVVLGNRWKSFFFSSKDAARAMSTWGPKVFFWSFRSSNTPSLESSGGKSWVTLITPVLVLSEPASWGFAWLTWAGAMKISKGYAALSQWLMLCISQNFVGSDEVLAVIEKRNQQGFLAVPLRLHMTVVLFFSVWTEAPEASRSLSANPPGFNSSTEDEEPQIGKDVNPKWRKRCNIYIYTFCKGFRPPTRRCCHMF